MERIGIYGGTYNPPQMGHMLAAKQAAEFLKLDRLLIMPDRIAPHKQLPEGSASPAQRYEMLKLAFSDIPGAEVSDLELRREGTSYTYLTVQQLRQLYPQAQLVLLMGTDMFLSFHTWKNPDIIARCAILGVLYRGEKGEAEAIARQKQDLEAQGMRVELIYNAVTAISSTDLRRMLVFQCAAPFLHPDVLTYIQQNGLYGAVEDYRQLPMQQLEATVVSLLKPNRVAHVLGCRDTAVALAKRWGADETDAAIKRLGAFACAGQAFSSLPTAIRFTGFAVGRGLACLFFLEQVSPWAKLLIEHARQP